MKIATVAALALGGFAAGAGAQSFSIDWFTLDGGGGTSTGGAYSLSGTVGQPDAGAMSGGAYSLTGGFWSIGGEPAAPLLTIERIGGAVRVSWPRPAAGFVLDETPALTGSPTGGWSQVAFPYATNATHISVTVAMPAGNRFYRLRRS